MSQRKRRLSSHMSNKTFKKEKTGMTEQEKKKRRRRKQRALRWANDYMFKHGIEMPQCQIPGCKEKSTQRHIPDPSPQKKRYMNFYCSEHSQFITNPPKPSISEDEQERLSAEEQQKLLEQRKKAIKKIEIPDTYDITDLKKTKHNSKTKTAIQKEIRSLLNSSLRHVKPHTCENPNCKSSKVHQEILPYMRPDGSDYNVSFLCRSCVGKVPYDKLVLQTTPAYDLYQLAKEREGQTDEDKFRESWKEGNQFLIERLKLECSARNIFPESECTMCGAPIPEDQLFSPKTDIVFPRGVSHMHVAFFCEICKQDSDGLGSYDTMRYYGFEPQDLTEFAPPSSCLRKHLEFLNRIRKEIDQIPRSF